MDNKQLIVKKAAEVFLRYGIRSVTMDDLSRELGISKKTLYQHVADKEELIMEVLNLHSCEECQNFGLIEAEANDAVEELLLISQWNQDTIRSISPVIIYDLQKYHPKLWRSIQSADFQRNYDLLLKNLNKGIEQGLYRPELPTDIVVRLFIAQIEGMIQDYIFPPESNLIAQGIIVKDNLFIRGIATQAGLAKLEHYRTTGLRQLPLSFIGKALNSTKH